MPMIYSDEERESIKARVLAGLAAGTPLTVLCREDGMPCDDTVRDWGEADTAFGRAIARAREAGFDAIALEALAIADETHLDTKKREDGSETADTEWISRSRLRVETRLKLLAKWDPKRYGDLIKHSGPDGTGPAMAALTVAFVNPGQQQSADEG